MLRRHLSTLLFFAFVAVSFSASSADGFLSNPKLLNRTENEEIEKLLQIIDDSRNSQHTIGNLISIQLPNQSETTEAYVVLYKLPQELHERYKDQFIIPGFIKALAIRSQTELNADGSTKNFTPKARTEIEDARTNPYWVSYPRKIAVPLSYGTYELEATLQVHYKRSEISEEEALRHVRLINEAISENWIGKIGRLSLRPALNIQPVCDDCDNKDRNFRFGFQVIDISISPNMKRSYVMMYEKTGYWQTQQRYGSEEIYKKMVAHEFGHLLGFRDLYTDVAYYDVAGNLLSITDFMSLSIFAPLNSLSPFAHMPRFNAAPIASHNSNIRASSTMGHVTEEHLEALVQAYNRNCLPFPGEQPWEPFLQHRR